MNICRKMLTLLARLPSYQVTAHVPQLMGLLHKFIITFEYLHENQSSKPNSCEKSLKQLVGGRLLRCREQSLHSLLVPLLNSQPRARQKFQHIEQEYPFSVSLYFLPRTTSMRVTGLGLGYSRGGADRFDSLWGLVYYPGGAECMLLSLLSRSSRYWSKSMPWLCFWVGIFIIGCLSSSSLLLLMLLLWLSSSNIETTYCCWAGLLCYDAVLQRWLSSLTISRRAPPKALYMSNIWVVMASAQSMLVEVETGATLLRQSCSQGLCMANYCYYGAKIITNSLRLPIAPPTGSVMKAAICAGGNFSYRLLLIVAVMIRRRSTLDPQQKQKRAKLVEIYAILDLCLQLPAGDRLLIRNQIKTGDQELANRIHENKRTKNYHQLQIYLRKFVHRYKQANKFGIASTRHIARGRTPLGLKSAKNQTESSYHNSLRNSLQSSPSAKKPTQAPPVLHTHLKIQSHIRDQIKKEINQGIQMEQCEVQCRDVAPRQIKVQAKPHICKSISTNDFKNNGEYHLNLKKMLKTKLVKNKQIETSYRDRMEQGLKENFSPEFGPTMSTQQSAKKNKEKIMSLYSVQCTEQSRDTSEGARYGQFHKRIKKVIELVR